MDKPQLFIIGFIGKLQFSIALLNDQLSEGKLN